MSYTAIQVDCQDGIATLCFNQPEQRNALSQRLMDESRSALAQLSRDPSVRALIVTGNGAAFCAGGDLSVDMPEDAEQRAEQATATLRERVNPLVKELRSFRCPSVAAVQGIAAGAGASLALATDITIAAQSASFLFPFMPRLGIVPDAGGTWLVPNKIGYARTMGACLLGDRIPASQAEQWGLIWSCVDDDALQEAAKRIAKRLAKGPRHAALEMRQALEQAQSNDFVQQLAYEERAQHRLLGSAEFSEGVRAFMAKRDPDFD